VKSQKFINNNLFKVNKLLKNKHKKIIIKQDVKVKPIITIW